MERRRRLVRGVDSPHELRGWRDTAPDVAIGMEGAPGHQATSITAANGGRGGGRGFYEASPGVDSFPGYAPTATENPYRSYGGFDWMTAKLGGVWDSMLAEGRPWTITATSDSHQVYGDFWPGQYSSTLVGAASRSYVDIMRGLQDDKVVAVHGRLIDGLDPRVRARSNGDTVRGIVAVSAIDEVVGIGVPVTPDSPVDTRGFVRPTFTSGRLVLLVEPAAGGLLRRPLTSQTGKPAVFPSLHLATRSRTWASWGGIVTFWGMGEGHASTKPARVAGEHTRGRGAGRAWLGHGGTGCHDRLAAVR